MSERVISTDVENVRIEQNPSEECDAGRDSERGGPAALRTRRLQYALGASLGGKLSSLLVQLIAMPVAVRALGSEQFALYLILAAAAAWLLLAEVGIGPVLVSRTALAVARHDLAEQRRLLSSAAALIGMLAVALGGISYGILATCPVEGFFGPHYTKWASTIDGGLAILVGFSILAILCSVVEAVQAGYQEQHERLVWQIAANIASLGTLLAAALWWPTVLGMILAVNLPLYVARGLNALRFLRKRPFLLPALRDCRIAYMKEMLGDGFYMWLGSLCHVLCVQAPLLIVGRNLSPSATACFGAGMNILVLLTSAMLMVVWPVWPAMADSRARGDVSWASSVYRKTLTMSVSLSALIAIALSLTGSRIVPLWLGPSIRPTTLFMTLLSLYFVVSQWEYVHFMMLMGLNRIRKGSVPWFLRSCLAIGSISLLVGWAGENGVLLCLIGSVVLVSAVPMWLAVRNALNEEFRPHTKQEGAAPAGSDDRPEVCRRESGPDAAV